MSYILPAEPSDAGSALAWLSSKIGFPINSVDSSQKRGSSGLSWRSRSFRQHGRDLHSTQLPNPLQHTGRGQELFISGVWGHQLRGGWSQTQPGVLKLFPACEGSLGNIHSTNIPSQPPFAYGNNPHSPAQAKVHDLRLERRTGRRRYFIYNCTFTWLRAVSDRFAWNSMKGRGGAEGKRKQAPRFNPSSPAEGWEGGTLSTQPLRGSWAHS